MAAVIAALHGSAEAQGSGLIGYWSFDGNGADASGNGRHLTLYGDIGFAPGLSGQALDLPGDASKYAARDVDDAVFDFGEDDFTVQVWVLFRSTDGEQVLVEKWTDAAGPGWTLSKLSDNALIFPPLLGTTSLAITTDVWNHIVVRREASHADMFFNGTKVAENTTFGVVGDTDRPLLVGKRNDGDGRGFQVNGLVDELAIWSRALTDTEIVALYSDGSGQPLAVQLLRFTARRSGPAVVLEWETATEFDHAGFRILREEAGGRLTNLTPRLIAPASAGGELGGATYRYVDRQAPWRSTRYWLEDVDTNGMITRHGAVEAPAYWPRLLPMPVLPLPQSLRQEGAPVRARAARIGGQEGVFQ